MRLDVIPCAKAQDLGITENSKVVVYADILFTVDMLETHFSGLAMKWYDLHKRGIHKPGNMC